MKVGFVGLSHLGLIYSMATAAKHFNVVAYDPDRALAARCQAGDFPIKEPGFLEAFTEHRARLEYTSESGRLADCDLVFYAQDVRTNDLNESDLAPLNKLINDTAPLLAASAAIVVLSQVFPGYTRKLVADLSSRPEVKVTQFFYQVETLVFGDAMKRALEPERYIVGATEAAHPLSAAFREWHAAFSCPVLTMRFESAELAKLAINFFLVSSVTTTNVLAEVCEAIGADWREIVPALRLDRRIGQYAYLSPGLGIAGGNLERDLVTVLDLARRHDTDESVVRAWQANSLRRRQWPENLLRREVLARVNDPLLAVWGLTYKPDTHSTKNSPALALLRQLREFRVRAHDPVAVIDVDEFGWVERCATPLQAVEGADALVIMTPWTDYAGADPHELKKHLRTATVIDAYGVLNADACRAAGLMYHRLGC